jgi:hypothetical protein
VSCTALARRAGLSMVTVVTAATGLAGSGALALPFCGAACEGIWCETSAPSPTVQHFTQQRAEPHLDGSDFGRGCGGMSQGHKAVQGLGDQASHAQPPLLLVDRNATAAHVRARRQPIALLSVTPNCRSSSSSALHCRF